MRNTVLGLLSLFLLLACKQEIKKETPVATPLFKAPIGTHSSLASLFSDEEKLWMSWVEKENDSLTVLKYTSNQDSIWQEAQEITRGTNWFVNWADFPSIAAQNGNLISHTLKKSSKGTYSYDVKLNLKKVGEDHWKTDVDLHTDNTYTEHGFVSSLPYKKGFFLSWLDGRNTEEDENGNRGAMTIRGAEVSLDGSIQNEFELDARVCDCCQTTAAITANGPVVIYRDRSDDEIRDMSIVRWENESWTAPKPLYSDDWKIEGCPVNGPKAAAMGNSLAGAWFTAAEGQSEVKLVFSEDNGSSFKAPVLISKNHVIGRVDATMVNETIALVSWMETENEKTYLKAAKVNRNGTKGTTLIIAEMAASRSSGFPQMEYLKGKVHFAWTDVSKTGTQIQMTYKNLTEF